MYSNVFKCVQIHSNAFKIGGDIVAKRNKAKLTTSAIAFIIEKRTDRANNYTFDEIADLLSSDKEFNISITGQSVGRSYRKYKDDKAYKNIPTVVNSIDKNSDISISENEHSKKSEPMTDTSDSKKTVRKHIEVKTNDSKEFDEDAHKKYDYRDFLKPL